MVLRFKIYGAAAGIVVLAWLTDLLMKDFLSESSLAFFIAAALLSAWYGGLGPGLAAIGVTIALSLAFHDHPDLSLAIGVHGIEHLLVFSAVGFLVVWLTARSRRSEKLLTQFSRNLEKKVERRTAALAESNRALEAFCYTLAHDLRSPARAIEGFAHLLLDDDPSMLPANGRKYVERIRNSAERMGQLIVDLLGYTNLTQTTFNRQAIDLNQICRDVLRMFTDEIERTQTRVSIDISAYGVLGDRHAVERVLVNLLNNAFKFIHPEREPHLRIATEAKGAFVRIWVEDNGIGIDPKYAARIFGVFERLSRNPDQPGTGIGLAIVKRSVEKMEGRIRVESMPGIGSRFWFELPAAAIAPSEPALAFPLPLPNRQNDACRVDA